MPLVSQHQPGQPRKNLVPTGAGLLDTYHVRLAVRMRGHVGLVSRHDIDAIIVDG